MPIYVYKCVQCTHKRDLLVRSWDDLSGIHVICDVCFNTMLRDINEEKPNFQLKGGNWASNGYSNTDRNCVTESDKEVKETEKQRIKEAKKNGTY